MRLSSAINQLVASRFATDLQADLRLGADSAAGFEAIGDVATFSDGRIAVLDIGANSISVFTVDGRRIREFGRAGGAPDEFQRPIAIAALDSDLIVLQASATRPLLRMTLEGRFVAAASVQLPGDWRGMVQRGPMLMQDGLAATASGSEDVTRRLAVMGGDIVVLIQDPADEDSTRASHAHVLRFSKDLVLLDTIQNLPAAPVHRTGVGPLLQGHPFYVKLFEKRPILSAATTWIATAWSGDTSISLGEVGHRGTMSISWPASHRMVSGQDRTDVAEWTARRTLLLIPGASESAAAMSRDEYARQINMLRTQLPFAETAPELTAMYLNDRCLWIAGFAPHDQTDGTSLTLVGLGLYGGVRAALVRVTRPDGRLRHIDGRGIYVSFLDSLGTPLLERFPLTGAESACGA